MMMWVFMSSDVGNETCGSETEESFIALCCCPDSSDDRLDTGLRLSQPYPLDVSFSNSQYSPESEALSCRNSIGVLSRPDWGAKAVLSKRLFPAVTSQCLDNNNNNNNNDNNNNNNKDAADSNNIINVIYIYSAILCSRADSLRTLACDSEWVAVSFYSAYY